MNDEPQQGETEPIIEPTDAATRAADLERLAQANLDATFGDQETSKLRVPGVISGDVGPKGKASAQLRALSRRERSAHGEVPRGSVSPNGARLLLLPMLGFAALLIAIVVLIGWLSS